MAIHGSHRLSIRAETREQLNARNYVGPRIWYSNVLVSELIRKALFYESFGHDQEIPLIMILFSGMFKILTSIESV